MTVLSNRLEDCCLWLSLEEESRLHDCHCQDVCPLQWQFALHGLGVQAFKGAIERAIRTRKRQDSEVHVLDMGCGTGFLSSCAAKAGADTVLACDLHHPMCDLTRQVALPGRNQNFKLQFLKLLSTLQGKRDSALKKAWH